MKYGSRGEAKKVRRSDLKAAEKARDFFEGYSVQEMAIALLILMVDLGRRVNEKEEV